MDDEDKLTAKDIFHQAMQGVKKIQQNKVLLTATKKLRKPRSRDGFTDVPTPPSTVSAADKLFYKDGNLPRKLVSQLKSGKLEIEAIVDLHGMTVVEANEYLEHFLKEAVAHDYFCICVVHGKGRKRPDDPTLKNEVNRYLRSDPRVLAFSSAPPKQGGTGAVNVILRQR